MGISRIGVLLLVLISVSAVGCKRSEPAAVVADRAGATTVPPYQIPGIELRGAKRPRSAARLQSGHVIFPQGDVTAAVGGMAGGPLEVPQGDLETLIDMIESTSMKRGDDDTRVSDLDAYLYLDADVGGGEHSVIDLRFGAGDAVLLTNYGYGSRDTDAAYYQTRSPRLATRLRDAVGYRRVDRGVLQGAQSATLLSRAPADGHALTTEEVALVRGAFLRAKLRSRDDHMRIGYDCTFDFRLPRDGGQIVTYDSGAGRLGLGPDVYEVEFADMRALRSLVGAHLDATKIGTESTTIDAHYRQ